MKKTVCPSVLFALSFWAASAQGSPAATPNDLVLGPYVPSATQESAVVAFELAQPASATVTVKTDGGDVAYQSERPQTLHFVTIAGLQPGRAYEYAISVPATDLDGRGEGLLKTASLPGESFTFTVIGDTRPGENRVTVHHAGLAEQMALLDPAFSLFLGDLVDDGRDPGELRAFFDVEKDVRKRAVLFPVLGDNDYADGQGLLPRYFPNLKKGYYSFEWGGVYFFALHAWDTKGRQSGSEFDETSEQFRWLASELAKPQVQKAPFRVVFLHDPVFISRGRASRLLQETLAPLFEASRVDLVFASWHLYERSRVKRVNYVISGGGGAELLWGTPNPDFKAIAEAKRYHFCRVDVGAGGLTLRAIAQDGTVLDQISLATNLGDDTRDEEALRFASRMARLTTYGDNKKLVVPVYVFDAREDAIASNTAFVEAARSLDATIAVYAFNLRKRDVFDLLLLAKGATGGQLERLPAVFVGARQLTDLEELPKALEEAARSPRIDLFNGKSTLSELRASTFGALRALPVAMNGLRRSLTVGGFLWLLGFASLLIFQARRGGKVIKTGGVALGGALLICTMWDLFYFDIIKMVPAADLLATMLGPRDSALVFFEIQAMLSEPSFRGSALMYLTLRTSVSLLPAIAVMAFVKMFVRPSRSTENVKAHAS
ncbi:MAG: metallophosphoesterase [Myxococcota bacterium]|jgi:hypothetical protein|nr:metallophosphoesterase [Myxococcota bacterium]